MNDVKLRAATAALMILSLVTGACTTAAVGGEPPDQPAAAPTEETADPARRMPIRVDWSGPTLPPTTLPGGWELTRCEGDAPLLCVADGDAVLGTIGSGRWTPEDPVGDAVAFLHAQLADHLDAFADDRATACGAGYRFGLDGEPRVLTVDGSPALTYATVGTDAAGKVHERAYTTTIVAGDEVVWIAAVASDPEGCMGGGAIGEFTPADLEEFAPWYAAMIDGSTLGGALPDGEHQARVRLDGDVVTVDLVEVLSGDAARDAAVAAGVIADGEDLPNDVYVDDADARTWSVPLASDVTISLVDCGAGCELVSVSSDDWRAGEVSPWNGEHALFDLTVVDGHVRTLAEIYTP